jgi:hypothetical protein
VRLGGSFVVREGNVASVIEMTIVVAWRSGKISNANSYFTAGVFSSQYCFC